MLTKKYLWKAYDRLLRQDELDRDPPSPVNEMFERKSVVPPGSIIRISEPEYIGSLENLPPWQGIDVNTLEEIPVKTGPSIGEAEFREHGSIALRMPVCISNGPWENTIDETWSLAIGGTVLVRAKEGGFYMTSLEKKRNGSWFVRCGTKKLDISLCPKRKLWVVRKLP